MGMDLAQPADLLDDGKELDAHLFACPKLSSQAGQFQTVNEAVQPSAGAVGRFKITPAGAEAPEEALETVRRVQDPSDHVTADTLAMNQHSHVGVAFPERVSDD